MRQPPKPARSRAHDRRLERHRARAWLRERPVCAGVVCRQDLPHAQERRRQAARLRAVAGRLLHVLDLLRQRRPRRVDRLQLHSGLSRPHPAVRVRLALPAAHRPAGQEPQHHLGRRLSGRPLRQEPGRRRHRHGHRGGRHAPLHRAAAQSRGPVRHRAAGRAPAAALQPRHGIGDRALDGHLCRPVRHPAHRRHRAPGRPDRGRRGRVARQARGLPRRSGSSSSSRSSAASADSSSAPRRTTRSSGYSRRTSTAASGSPSRS